MIVAFNAEKHISRVLARIPYEQLEGSYEIAVFDDASEDKTSQAALEAAKHVPLPIRVLSNPQNLGYGGNQKLGYQLQYKRASTQLLCYTGMVNMLPNYSPKSSIL